MPVGPVRSASPASSNPVCPSLESVHQMIAWSLSPSRTRLKKTATELYGRLVTHSRAPELYRDLAVPDTPEGRLEMVLLHMALAMGRLKVEGAEGEPLARALAEAFVTDMDDCLREMGVGDLTVPKKVKKAAAALFDRVNDYGAALEGGTDERLAVLFGTNVWQDPASSRAARLASYAQSAHRLTMGGAREAVLAGAFDATPALSNIRT